MYSIFTLKQSDLKIIKRVPKFFYPFRRKGKKVFSGIKCKFCIHKDTSCYYFFQCNEILFGLPYFSLVSIKDFSPV
ncbi:hypothetical protein BDE36_1335 [Arcticibacter tournemirensis]|nr:hypothetical protein BDE36_1335 [Arcticibacter tournemirensis]